MSKIQIGCNGRDGTTGQPESPTFFDQRKHEILLGQRVVPHDIRSACEMVHPQCNRRHRPNKIDIGI
jgi:hypothetical protein